MQFRTFGLPQEQRKSAPAFRTGSADNPTDANWLNRDRFVLSASHGSMFLYGWLHLAGFDLSLDELKNFRQLHSKTPGHPEFEETPGSNAPPVPWGRGLGMRWAWRLPENGGRSSTPPSMIFDHQVTLAGDGCLQEGVAADAPRRASRLGQLDHSLRFQRRHFGRHGQCKPK